MNMRHLLNAVLLVAARAELPDLTSAKRVKAQYLVTLALQSYKGEVHGAAEMMTFFGASVDQNNWNRDWRDLWIFLKAVIEEVDIQA